MKRNRLGGTVLRAAIAFTLACNGGQGSSQRDASGDVDRNDDAPPLDGGARERSNTDGVGDASVNGNPTAIPCDGCTLTMLDISGSDIVYDAHRRRLYLAGSGASPYFPNTLVTIDPASTSVVSAVHIGSSPSTLALSDDASTLWVGVGGPLAIRKVDLTATPPAIGPLHRLPDLPSATPASAGKIAVLPGSPGSLAVSMLGLGWPGVFVLDEGIPRPMNTSRDLINAYELIAGPAGVLFAHHVSSDSFAGALVTLRVSSTGVALAGTSTVVGRAPARLVYSSGRVYASTGQTVDVSDPAAPIAGPALPGAGPIALRSADRLLMITPGADSSAANPWRLIVIDTSTATELASLPLPSTAFPAPTPDLAGEVAAFVYAGDDTVAILQLVPSGFFPRLRTQLYLLKAPLVALP